MAAQDKSTQGQEKITGAYRRMMERVREFLERPEAAATPRLRKAVDAAKERAMALGELSREEAERLGEYLVRDVEDAAKYIADTGQGLADWMRLDLLLVEQRLSDIFAGMVDQTRLELEHLQQRADKYGVWHSGEMASMGVFECAQCAARIHFSAPGAIPSCPRCEGKTFKRVVREG